uniref:ABC multidrug transporter n=1 Tax=Colletotrichum fructicola (strain Nara gc5) TaxID=1213859 RepID=L2G2V8_COLFN
MEAVCLCSSVRLLSNQYDESQARNLIPALNRHLEDLRRLLAQSKSLSRDVQFHVTPRNQRTSKALAVDSLDLTPVNQVREQFRENIDGFWAVSDNRVPAELRRRLACVVIFLRSKLDAQVLVPPQVAEIFPGQHNYSDIRNSGRKYIQIARKLGGLGAILWLPLDVPPSTYERYLNIDDEEVFSHLLNLSPRYEDYTAFVQRLILSQLRDPALPSSYYNLFYDYADVLPATDQLLLLLYAYGGSDVPEALLKGVRSPQRRWNSDGEIETVTSDKFGLPTELTNLLSDDIECSRATESPYINKHGLEDRTNVWSLCSELAMFFSRVLTPKTMDELGNVALKLLCFVVPPCYEGNTEWSPTLKAAVWAVMDKATTTFKVPTPLKAEVIDALLYFSERDHIPMRRAAVDRAKSFLRKPMPYYFHASVVLSRSNLLRLDGEFAKSEAHIRDFIWRGPQPSTRKDHALLGRLHISQIENKIKCYDNDVSSFIYNWQAEQPLSTLDIEVTFRLQSTAARFFQSIGDFGAARASIEHLMSLDMTKPIRQNTRRLLCGRLADIYCNMQEWAMAADILQTELGTTEDAERCRRGPRRLLLASAEVDIGLQRLDAAEATLKELEGYEPAELDNLHDQQLHMRLFIGHARIASFRADRQAAVLRWKFALEEAQKMYTLGPGGGFTTAITHLSLAHALLAMGDRDGARESWAAGVEILRTEICEFWLPIVPTLWLQMVARDVHESQAVNQGSWVAHLKLILWHALAVIQILTLSVAAFRGGEVAGDTRVIIASGSLAITSSILFIFVSMLEHRRARAPSAVLQTSLLATIILDAARLPREWAYAYNGGLATVNLLTVQLVIKAVLLAAESASKPAFITIPATQATREELSGIFGRSLSLWLNPLFKLGWKKDLVTEDLEPVDEALSGEKLLERLSTAWKNVDQTRTHALSISLLKAFSPELLYTHFPRFIKVVFGLAQPVLVQITIEYIQNHETTPVEDGYWLIAQFALVFIGNAVSSLWTSQLSYRLITSIRGALIAIIYQNMLSLRAESGTSEAAVALMGTEVEWITVAAEWCLAVVPNLVQVALAMWILGNQLGATCITPVLIAIVSVLIAARLGKLIPSRQRRWREAIQKRVGVTTQVMGSVKGVKMSGLSGTVQDQIQGLRDFELEESKEFRKIQISNVLVGQLPSIMTPSITLAAFAIAQRLAGGAPLNVVQAFTSLSLLGILINPVSELVMVPRHLAMTIGCLDKIQEFLAKEKREDYRIVKSRRQGQPNGVAILHDLDLEIKPATLTMVVGPVGSGKSTLLKSLVGETYRIAGDVEYAASPEVAYCDQDPWILNQSIKDNITGSASYDAVLYDKVIAACQLEEDIRLLPDGDGTIVGSSGAALSGGQKHRIALARAMYSGQQVIIMDDTLKGLDSNTASKCFNALFSAQGLLLSIQADKERSIIFATHNAQWLRFADQILSLNADGKISERGSYEELSKSDGYVSKLRVTALSDSDEDTPENSDEEVKDDVEAPKKDKPVAGVNPNGAEKLKASRGAANTSSLLYYIKSMGTSAFLLFATMVLFQMGCRTMQRLWVKFWVAANEDHSDPNLGMWVGVYVLWGVLTEVAVAIETYYFLVIIVPHSAKGLHFGVLKAALAAPMSFFVKTDTGVIINRFSQDMNLIDLPLPLAFMLTFDYFTLAIAEIILTTLATPQLTLLIPLLFLALYLLQRIYLQTSRQIRLLDLEAKSPLFSHFLASAAGLVTIRALAVTAAAEAENLARLDMSQRAFYVMGSLQKWLLLVLNLVVAALAVLLVSLAVALRESVDAGLLGVALVSVMGFGYLLMLLLKYWADLETSLGAVARIREFQMETPAEVDGDAEVESVWPDRGLVRIRDVAAAYDDHQVLRGINLDIQPGEKVAICGRTGSGKSTLLALLLRLHDPSSGTIEVDGVDISTVPISRLRESLVALPQDALFLPGSVRRNLDPLSKCEDAEVWEALEKTRLKSLFEDKGGLDVDFETEWLSAGQKQLFCIARAMLRQSRVLLLDEATSSLDQATEKVVQDLIRSEFDGWTVIVIAHRLQAVVDFDKIVALQDGEVVEFDHPKTLLERGGVFASLWKLQEG